MRLPIDRPTIEVALLLSQQKDFVWLDSASNGRYSILACNPQECVCIQNPNDHERFQSFLKKQKFTTATASADCPFVGGWIGFVSYEAYALLDQIPLIPKYLPRTLAWFGRYETFVLVDHQNNTTHIIAPNAQEGENLLNLLTQKTLPLIKSFQATQPQASCDRTRYTVDFTVIKAAIEAGTFYEVNYTQEFSGQFTGSSFALYQNLRQVAPAPWMAYLNVDSQRILSASPECFFKVCDGRIHLFPIKGTARRSELPLEDAELKKNLAHSEKDRAELLMITDLLRNDLGRICQVGSIAVADLRRVESFSHYHHLVSEITGLLNPEITGLDLFNALFPGGSITGAPKIKSMEFIDRLESRARGTYTGAIGYFSNDGQANFNIPIRTLSIQDLMGRYAFATGGGIVADSECQAEFEECQIKAQGLLAALNRQT